jgi:hypothetical protein
VASVRGAGSTALANINRRYCSAFPQVMTRQLVRLGWARCRDAPPPISRPRCSFEQVSGYSSKLRSATHDRDDGVFAVVDRLLKERPTEQFATLVKFDVLPCAGVVDCFALAHERKAIGRGPDFCAGPVRDRDDLCGPADPRSGRITFNVGGKSGAAQV